MKKLTYSLFLLALLISAVSCSSSSKSPVLPSPSEQFPQENNTVSDGILTAGSLEIDLDSMTIDVIKDRTSEFNYNITGFLGSNFQFSIVGINGSVLEILLDITNPTALQVHDVRIIFTNLYGKQVMNPDSYTDLFAKQIISPFIAFAKEYSLRAFPVGPGANDTETLFLDFPPGSPATVDFIVVASLGGNTADPYELNSLSVSGQLTPLGGSADLSLVVLDHQGDISAVTADTTVLTGTYTSFTEDPVNPGLFSATISNTQGAPVGTYSAIVRANSPNTHNAATYHYFSVDVETGTTSDYDLVLSTVRSTTFEITALRLDWNAQPGAIDYNIYVIDPFDPMGSYTLITDGTNTNTFYEDSSIAGYEGYQYYITVQLSTGEGDPSNEVVALLEDGEGDNVATNSPWEMIGGTNANIDFKTMQWDLCYSLPANGIGHWNPRGFDYIVPTDVCTGWWTGSFTMLCSPEIPIPADSATAYIEFNVQVKTLYPQFFQAGGNVGVADAVMNTHYWPSMDYRDGWPYNCDSVDGFTYDYVGLQNYPNCDDSNDAGFAYRDGDEYHFSSYNLPDLLTMSDARATLAWASANSTTTGSLNYDDVAVIVY